MTFSARSRTSAFYALALTLTLACQDKAYSRAPRTERLTERCDTALAYIRLFLPTKGGWSLVFSEADDRAALSVSDEDWRRPDGRPASSPPGYLLKEASVSGQYSALARCSAIRKWMTFKNIRIAKNVPSEILQPSSGDVLRRSAVIVNLPVMNKRGNEAIIITSEISGPLAAGTYAIFLTRQAGSPWKVTAMKDLAVA